MTRDIFGRGVHRQGKSSLVDGPAAMQNALINGTSLIDGSFSFRIERGDTGSDFLTAVMFNDEAIYFAPD